MMDPVKPSKMDMRLDEALKSVGLNDGLNALSIKAWGLRWKRENRLELDKFKEYLTKCVEEWIVGKRRLVYPGDGSIEMVPIETK